MKSIGAKQIDPVAKEWPIEGLENPTCCPICGGVRRRLLYRGLRDRIFFCSPGSWNMYGCQSCGSAYLDPRPTPETIGFAYRTYFTHNKKVVAQDSEEFSWPRRIRRMLANGYRNYRFGTKLPSASRLGVIAAMLLPRQRRIIDAELRHIPRCNGSERLLDVGCGNGEFLSRARTAGWDVIGVDPDPKAVEVACSLGLDVRQGGIEALDPVAGLFDGITLSHVIEHVHDPLILLRHCHALLKPGGWLWVETPNLEALGHRRYKSNWRGLEPPRHLVLFTRSSLIGTLHQSGFQKIRDQPYRPLCASIFAASEAIANSEDSMGPADLLKERRRAVKAAERQAQQDPAVREFITLKAWKSP